MGREPRPTAGAGVSWEEHSDAAKGWLFPDERDALWDYASKVAHRGPLLEIGGYCGKSAIVLGDAARVMESVLFSVDWHRGSPEMAADRECHDPDMMTDGLFDSLPHFRRNVHAAGLEQWVVPVVGNSTTVGEYWETPLSFLFIDGAHDDVGVARDYLLWSRHILAGGLLAFHDTTIPGIDETARRATREGFELVEQIDTLRILRAT